MTDKLGNICDIVVVIPHIFRSTKQTSFYKENYIRKISKDEAVEANDKHIWLWEETFLRKGTNFHSYSIHSIYSIHLLPHKDQRRKNRFSYFHWGKAWGALEQFFWYVFLVFEQICGTFLKTRRLAFHQHPKSKRSKVRLRVLSRGNRLDH